MLARGVCRAEAASGGTRLAFGANQFQSWLRRPRIRRVPPAGSPAKAGWWYRLRTRRAPAPGGMSPSPEVRQGQPRPHFQPKNRQELFALPESFFKATLAHAPSQNSEDTRDGAGAGREWWEARERGNDRGDHLPEWLGSRPSSVSGTRSWEQEFLSL